MSDTWTDHEFAETRGHPSTWKGEVMQLRAENARLRDVLKTIQRQMDYPQHYNSVISEACDKALEEGHGSGG